MLFYTHTITPRLQYILDFFSEELFDRPIQITDDRAQFAGFEGPALNYSAEPMPGSSFFIRPVSLLFEKDIRPQPTGCFSWRGDKALFPTEGDLGFDIFAAAFYLLSRYEEYLPHEKDLYGRYAHIHSIAFREGFLQVPLINLWMEAFKETLLQKFPGLSFRRKAFKCRLSYDIDAAYSYKYKGFVRTAGGFIKDLFKGRGDLVKVRWRVWRNRQPDPFDCFEWLDALHLYCRLKPYYFFLVARRQTGVDKNNPTHIKAVRQLIEYYTKAYKAGIHPSWQSGDDFDLLKEELEWLEVIADKEIIRSRQHFIRFTLPQTFRELIKAGIRKDFSMGYGSINGFRASVCSSFYWYDLEKEETTPLRLYPFCYMDANSYYEQKDSPQEAYRELIGYYDQVKRLRGIFISIWHNSILGTAPEFKGWGSMFELFMRETVYWDAYSD